MAKKFVPSFLFALVLSSSAFAAVGGSNPRPQAVGGSNPRPQATSPASTSDVTSLVTAVQTVLGL